MFFCYIINILCSTSCWVDEWERAQSFCNNLSDQRYKHFEEEYCSVSIDLAICVNDLFPYLKSLRDSVIKPALERNTNSKAQLSLAEVKDEFVYRNKDLIKNLKEKLEAMFKKYKEDMSFCNECRVCSSDETLKNHLHDSNNKYTDLNLKLLRFLDNLL